MCKRAGHGMNFFTSITKLPIFTGYLFDENADIVQGYYNINTSGKSLLPDFKGFMRQWNGGIRASGGAVCQKKIKWFLIDFKRNGKNYGYRSIKDMPGEISILDKDGTMITITPKEPSSENESL